MAVHVFRRSPAARAHRNQAQSLVELAIVMPLFLGLVTVLFQLGILFIAYLSIVHETRDIGRFVAVHPDTIDGTTCLTPNSLWKQVCDDAPSVIDSTRITQVTFSPACATLTSGKCTTPRLGGTTMHISVNYDARSLIFLPTQFRLGPWLNVAIPSSLPAYNYWVMVEPH
jgi:TadE-like protein